VQDHNRPTSGKLKSTVHHQCPGAEAIGDLPERWVNDTGGMAKRNMPLRYAKKVPHSKFAAFMRKPYIVHQVPSSPSHNSELQRHSLPVCDRPGKFAGGGAGRLRPDPLAELRGVQEGRAHVRGGAADQVPEEGGDAARGEDHDQREAPGPEEEAPDGSLAAIWHHLRAVRHPSPASPISQPLTGGLHAELCSALEGSRLQSALRTVMIMWPISLGGIVLFTV